MQSNSLVVKGLIFELCYVMFYVMNKYIMTDHEKILGLNFFQHPKERALEVRNEEKKRTVRIKLLQKSQVTYVKYESRAETEIGDSLHFPCVLLRVAL